MRLLSGLSVLLLSAIVVWGAQEGGGDKKDRGDFDVFFRKLDANMDGKLNRDEFLKMAERAKEKTQARKKLGEEYDKLDPQRTGLTKDLFKRYIDDRKKK